MGAGSFDQQVIIDNSVDQQPVIIDVAFAVSGPFTPQIVVFVFSWKWFSASEKPDHFFCVLERFSPLLHSSHV